MENQQDKERGSGLEAVGEVQVTPEEIKAFLLEKLRELPKEEREKPEFLSVIKFLAGKFENEGEYSRIMQSYVQKKMDELMKAYPSLNDAELKNQALEKLFKILMTKDFLSLVEKKIVEKLEEEKKMREAVDSVLEARKPFEVVGEQVDAEGAAYVLEALGGIEKIDYRVNKPTKNSPYLNAFNAIEEILTYYQDYLNKKIEKIEAELSKPTQERARRQRKEDLLEEEGNKLGALFRAVKEEAEFVENKYNRMYGSPDNLFDASKEGVELVMKKIDRIIQEKRKIPVYSRKESVRLARKRRVR